MRVMKNIYADMLTKELVRLRVKHKKRLQLLQQSRNYMKLKEAQSVEYLLIQIDKELADRVENGWISV